MMAEPVIKRNIEFFDRDHFHQNFHRKKAKRSLSRFIDFFWETDFDHLWNTYPAGFEDLLFPNVGYTYLINLGSPFTMKFDDTAFTIRNDGFLPRYKNITTIHSPGNRVFGIKFRVSPIIFEKKIDFSEYSYIFPLSYLIDRSIVDRIKQAATFTDRVSLISDHYTALISRYEGSLKYVDVVTTILSEEEKNNFTTPIERIAGHQNLSVRTLQRYFEAATGTSCKQALQVMRIRKALSAFIEDRKVFNLQDYGYFDRSHFQKHARQFLQGHKEANLSTHLQLLNGSGIIDY